MNSENPEDDPLEEFEREFSLEKDHPLLVLGSWVVVLTSCLALLFWVLFLLDTLRH